MYIKMYKAGDLVVINNKHSNNFNIGSVWQIAKDRTSSLETNSIAITPCDLTLSTLKSKAVKFEIIKDNKVVLHCYCGELDFYTNGRDNQHLIYLLKEN